MADDLDHLLGVQTTGRPDVAPPSGDNEAPTGDFPALQIIAILYKILASMVAVAGVVSFFVLVSTLSGDTGPLLVAVAVAVLTAVVSLILWGIAELILLFLRIEQNTRQRR